MTEHDKRLYGYSEAPGLNPDKSKKMSVRKKIGVVALSVASLIAVHRPATHAAKEVVHTASHRLDNQFPDTDKFEKVADTSDVEQPDEVVETPEAPTNGGDVSLAPANVSFIVQQGDTPEGKARQIAGDKADIKDILPVENAILMESQKDGKPGLQIGEKITITNPNPGVHVDKSTGEGE